MREQVWALRSRLIQRRVTCLNCGFLSFGDAEPSGGDRLMLTTLEGGAINAKVPNLERLRCYRSLWAEYDADYFGNPSEPTLEIVNETRCCPGFRRHRPGFSPNEHKQMVVKSEERRIQLLWILVGAAATLVVQWLAKHLGFPKS